MKNIDIKVDKGKMDKYELIKENQHLKEENEKAWALFNKWIKEEEVTK